MTTPTAKRAATPSPVPATADAPAHRHTLRCYWDVTRARWSCSADHRRPTTAEGGQTDLP